MAVWSHSTWQRLEGVTNRNISYLQWLDPAVWHLKERKENVWMSQSWKPFSCFGFHVTCVGSEFQQWAEAAFPKCHVLMAPWAKHVCSVCGAGSVFSDILVHLHVPLKHPKNHLNRLSVLGLGGFTQMVQGYGLGERQVQGDNFKYFLPCLRWQQTFDGFCQWTGEIYGVEKVKKFAGQIYSPGSGLNTSP